MAANNMSNIHVFPNAFSTLMPLQSCSQKSSFKSHAEFTGKHPCWSVFSIKLQAGGACIFIEKRLQHRCFHVKFAKLSRTPILKCICKRLLLHLKYYTPAKNTAEAVTKFSKIETAEEEISHSMLDNYEVKNYLLNPIHHCKPEILNFQK